MTAPAPTYPAQVLDLANWKLTLPIGSKGSPTEIKQPTLAKYVHADYFVPQGDGVRFRAPVNGITTSGSANPRSELREMNGSALASWSSTDGKTHTAVVDEAVTHLPNDRTDGGVAAVVCLQIHDASDDISVFRVEAGKVYVTKGNDTHYAVADSAYALGTRFRAMFVVADGIVTAYYNGRKVCSFAAKFSGAYFKAGAYTQANASNSKPATGANYGETVIYDLAVAHGASVPTPADPPPNQEPPPVSEMPASGWPRDPHQPKRVIIVLRHGEKDDDGDGKEDTLHELSEVGKKRAEAIKAQFLKAELPAGLYHPDRAVASKGTTASNRPLKTIQPLVDASNGKLPLNTKYDFERDYKTAGPWLAARLDVTMACLEHSAIVATCKTFGKITPALPKAWDAKRFDLYWVFTSDDGKNWSFTQIPQKLLAGDKDSVIK